MPTITTRIRMRVATASTWVNENPTLYAAEWGYETDTGKVKVGDGVTLNGVSAGSASILTRYSGVELLKLGTDTWLMEGNHGVVA